MPVDYWSSTQFDTWTSGREYTHSSDEMVYIVNAIDSLADQLPKFVRNLHLHYTAMILAHRYVHLTTSSSLCPDTSLFLDGSKCCEIAALSLSTAMEADGKVVTPAVWDSAIGKVFPCEVVHCGVPSAVDAAKGAFLQTLKFDLFVYHPFEPMGLLLADLGLHPEITRTVATVALGVVNSLYRTTVIVAHPPYVVAVAAIVGASLLAGVGDAFDLHAWLAKLPVDPAVVESILCADLFGFVKSQEIPLSQPPAVTELPSPSSRTGRSVSRQSSRTSGKRSNSSRKPGRKPLDQSSLASLQWALLPVVSENAAADDYHFTRSGHRRPVCLSELRLLKEIARMNPPNGLIKLVEVKLYSQAEGDMHRTNVSGGRFVVDVLFDSTGSQFDSIVRLLGSQDQLLTVVEQLLSAVNFLNDVKICHYGIEPANIMVAGDAIKIASLATSACLPNVPTHLPSLPYRAPELLLGSTGGVKDDPLGVDLWSLGCVVSEIARIFVTRNRYEEPLFALADSLPARPEPKGPIADKATYTNCRYVMRIADCLNAGTLPAPDMWSSVHKRGSFQAANELITYRARKYPQTGVFGTHKVNDIKAYLKDTNQQDGIVTEIVKALLRWAPEKRANPRVCLARLIKSRVN